MSKAGQDEQMTKQRITVEILIGKAGGEMLYHCRKFPGAMSQRCFAFQPSDEQVTAENRNKQKKASLMMFPPTEGGASSLIR